MPTRLVRWIEGTTTSEEIRWNQVKRVQGTLDGEVLSGDEPSDRTTEFKIGKVAAYTAEQLAPVLRAKVHFVALLLRAVRGGLIRWHYDAEAGIVWWDEAYSIGGQSVRKRRETTDTTLVEAGHGVVKAIADMVSMPDKPVWPHSINLKKEGENVRASL